MPGDLLVGGALPSLLLLVRGHLGEVAFRLQPGVADAEQPGRLSLVVGLDLLDVLADLAALLSTHGQLDAGGLRPQTDSCVGKRSAF